MSGDNETKFDLETHLVTAMHLSAALAAALNGMDKVAIDEEPALHVLQFLADEARFASRAAHELCENS